MGDGTMDGCGNGEVGLPAVAEEPLASSPHDEWLGRPTWQHRGADWWDNCVDPEFVEFHARRGVIGSRVR